MLYSYLLSLLSLLTFFLPHNILGKIMTGGTRVEYVGGRTCEGNHQNDMTVAGRKGGTRENEGVFSWGRKGRGKGAEDRKDRERVKNLR